jgi:cobalt-zinc-cadmium efflux system membrane fusion protein
MSTPIYTTLLTALAALVLAGCGQREDSQAHLDNEEAAHVEGDDAEHHDQAEIDEKTAGELGIRTAKVGPGIVRDAHEVQGLLTPIEGKHARVRARYAGPVQSVRVGVGDVVKARQTLATVESNVSLTAYAVTAPFAGTILDVAAVPGDLAGDQPLFELADLSSLWVDLHLFGGDAQHIAAGMPVEIIRLSDGAQTVTKLDRILPGTATASQSTVARASIKNADGQWRPGAAVRARVTVQERQAALVVPVLALQTFEGETVVFTREGNSYTPRAVKLGERDAVNAEVLEGLKEGEEVVVEQSYLIKADLEKESAEHEH